MINGFLLGLSSSTSCLASCAPVMIPYMLTGGKTAKKNCIDLALFLFGRLLGYTGFGILAWLSGKVFLKDIVWRSGFLTVSYIGIGFLLAYYCFTRKRSECILEKKNSLAGRLFKKNFLFYPAAFGFASGISVCPPLLLAFTEAMSSEGLIACIVFFLAFFAGTSVFFIPLPALGYLRRYDEVRTIGRLTVYIIAAYYIIKGFMSLEVLLK